MTTSKKTGTAPSLPVRGAWIEIAAMSKAAKSGESLPVRGAWIEIDAMDELAAYGTSLPVRGAWIEMHKDTCHQSSHVVAPRKGSVD